MWSAACTCHVACDLHISMRFLEWAEGEAYQARERIQNKRRTKENTDWALTLLGCQGALSTILKDGILDIHLVNKDLFWKLMERKWF